MRERDDSWVNDPGLRLIDSDELIRLGRYWMRIRNGTIMCVTGKLEVESINLSLEQHRCAGSSHQDDIPLFKFFAEFERNFLMSVNTTNQLHEILRLTPPAR